MDGKPMRNDTPSQRTEPTSITVILYQRKICSIKNKSLHSIATVNVSNPWSSWQQLDILNMYFSSFPRLVQSIKISRCIHCLTVFLAIPLNLPSNSLQLYTSYSIYWSTDILVYKRWSALPSCKAIPRVQNIFIDYRQLKKKKDFSAPLQIKMEFCPCQSPSLQHPQAPAYQAPTNMSEESQITVTHQVWNNHCLICRMNNDKRQMILNRNV